MRELTHIFYTNGYRYEIIAQCNNDLECLLRIEAKETKNIPLVLTIDEVKDTFNKIDALPIKPGISYTLFCDIVAGAALLSMKRSLN